MVRHTQREERVKRRIAGFTLGCKVNQYDTEAMLECFERAGWEIVPFAEEADCYIINTCTVTHTGDAKSRKLIHRVNREHPSASIIAAGCLAQRAGSELAGYPGVKVVIGVQRRGECVELLRRAEETQESIDATGTLENAPFEKLTVTRHEGKTRAVMKIQEGCSRRCAYCIIPEVRGPVRGMELNDIREEAARLARDGYREIVITGIHLGSYERVTGTRLEDAIHAVCETEGVERVRLGSLEPGTVTERFAESLGNEKKLMHQFHLSLQSGSESVLRRMRRGYTPDMYMTAVDRLRDRMPMCAITTDIITGFPQETEEEFAETLAFAQRVGFARIHAFPYSRRAGTEADRMPGQVSEEVKKERTARLIALADRLEEEYVRSNIGRRVSVLFETDEGNGLCSGYSGEYVRTVCRACPGMIGSVLVTGCKGNIAEGILTEEEEENG